jgi:asparagine synthase (glutamine-hydrolysing)
LQELELWKTHANAETTFESAYWGGAIGFRQPELREILTPDFAACFYDPLQHRAPIEKAHRECLSVIRDLDLPRRVSLIELKIRLPELLLMRVDKMTMANSLECRVPFLDKELVELAFAIRTDVKISGGQPKSVLKKAVEGMIPAENIYRKKMGFHLPIPEWLRSDEIGGKFLDLILQSKLVRGGIVERNVIANLIAEHRSGTHNRYFKLWTLLTLSLWYERWAS